MIQDGLNAPTPRPWLALFASLLLIAGCGGTQSPATIQPRTTAGITRAPAARAQLGELLSVPAVGRIFGRCDPVEAHWTIEFLNDALATDGVAYRVAGGRSHSLGIDPGHSLTLRLIPGQYTSHEPADPRSRFPAQTLKTTVPVSLDIEQGSEPHIYRVEIRFAVAAAIGDTTDCALVSSTASATTYYPGGQPPS